MLFCWLWGCAPPSTPSRCDLSQPHLAIATTDYQSGALAAYVPATGCLDDRLSTLGPDPIVRAIPGGLAALDRTGGDTIRLFDRGIYDRPRLEVVLEVGGNAHDLVQIDDHLVVSLYDRDWVGLMDLDGDAVGQIDLAPHADADGLPEADRIVVVDGTAYLAVQRLTRPAHTLDQSGQLLALDVVGRTVSAVFDVGDNPKAGRDPLGIGVTILTGAFASPDGEAVRFDPGTGETTPVVGEPEIGLDLTHLVGNGAHAVLLAVPFAVGDPSRLLCIDLQTATITEGLQTDAWLRDAVAVGDRVWVGARTGWAFGGGGALYEVNPRTCAVDLATDGFTLDPDALAWVE